MTPEQLQQIKERAENATAGPWRQIEDTRGTIIHAEETKGSASVTLCRATSSSAAAVRDADFIAHARTDIPEPRRKKLHLGSQMKKTWCKHISWWPKWFPKPGGKIKSGWWIASPLNRTAEIPHKWKLCPICGAERPTRANKAAAQLRAAMDGGDEE